MPNEKLVSVITGAVIGVVTGAVTGENMENLTTGVTGIEMATKKMLSGQAEKSTGNNEKKNAMNTGRQSC